MFGAAKRGIQATTEMNTLESNRDTHPIAAAEPKQAVPRRQSRPFLSEARADMRQPKFA